MRAGAPNRPNPSIVRLGRWLFLCLVSGWCGWTLLWLAMRLSGGAWLAVDLALAYQAQLMASGACLLAWCVWRRRWVPSLLVGIGVMLAGGSLGIGRPVARPGVATDAAPPPGVVRVITANIHPQNERWSEDLERLFSLRPDIVVLIETPPELWRGIVRRGELDGTAWRHHERRAWVSDIASPCFVLSRWPLERLSFGGIADAERDVLIARVDHPERPFMVGAIHPHSPRSLSRYRRGNRQLRGTYEAIGRALASRGLPLVMGVDLNSGPAGWRAVGLRGAGLGMSKPWLGGGGSFPVGAPGVLRVQLDDVWRSRGVRVRAWSSVGGLDSDHRAVIADLEFGD